MSLRISPEAYLAQCERLGAEPELLAVMPPLQHSTPPASRYLELLLGSSVRAEFSRATDLVAPHPRKSWRI
ncbi:MAG: hypothetical protein AAF533_04720 [Acidobacteriota bacterium]